MPRLSRLAHHLWIGAATCALLIPLAVACGDASESLGIGPPSAGAFGQADVFPECGALNQACLSSGLNSPLAVGAKLGVGVNFKVAGNSGPPTTLMATRDDVLLVDGGVVDAVGTGIAAILILGPDGRVIDFIHVWVAMASELRIIRYSDVGLAIGAVREEATLLVGDELFVSVEAFDDSQPLLGLFKATWTTDVLEADPEATSDPVIVVDDIVFGWYRIVAREPGKIRLNVNALGLDKTLTLEVLP